jgi:hypothetical protein
MCTLVPDAYAAGVDLYGILCVSLQPCKRTNWFSIVLKIHITSKRNNQIPSPHLHAEHDLVDFLSQEHDFRTTVA